MAALSIAAHLYGNPDTWYDAGMPQPVLQFWASACPSGSGCWVDWQEGSLQCVLLVTGAYALAGSPLPAAGNAIDFWSLYQHRPGWLEVPSATAPPSQRGLPMPGDIMVWYDPPPLVGHVAIVVGVIPPRTRSQRVDYVCRSQWPRLTGDTDLAARSLSGDLVQSHPVQRAWVYQTCYHEWNRNSSLMLDIGKKEHAKDYSSDLCTHHSS